MSIENDEDETPEEENLFDLHYDYVVELIQDELSDADIVRRLVREGVQRQAAYDLLEEIRNHHIEAKSDDAKKSLFLGALFFLGGIFFTFASYVAGIESRRFVLFYGAILFGAFLIWRGVYQSQKN